MVHPFCVCKITSLLLPMCVGFPLTAKEPPTNYLPRRSTIVELDLATGTTWTVSEHRKQTTILLDLHDDVLVAVEFGGRGPSRMFGLSLESGGILWSLPTSNPTWEHFFHAMLLSGRDDFCFSLPCSDFGKAPRAGDSPAFGLAGEQLAGIDVHSGKVLWRINPFHRFGNGIAWRSVHGLQDHVIATMMGRVLVIDRTEGRVALDLRPTKEKPRFSVGRPVENTDQLFLTFDNGESKSLIGLNKQSDNVESNVDLGPVGFQLLAATDELVLSNEGGSVIARDSHDLDRVVWRQREEAWFDPGATPVLWRQHIVVRSSDLPTIRLRDGTVFSLFHQPEGRELHFANYPWAAQEDVLYTVSSAGMRKWERTLLESCGSPSLGDELWTPALEATNSKRSPWFVDCLMGNGKAYLVLVHEWDPVF